MLQAALVIADFYQELAPLLAHTRYNVPGGSRTSDV